MSWWFLGSFFSAAIISEMDFHTWTGNCKCTKTYHLNNTYGSFYQVEFPWHSLIFLLSVCFRLHHAKSRALTKNFPTISKISKRRGAYSLLMPICIWTKSFMTKLVLTISWMDLKVSNRSHFPTCYHLRSSFHQIQFSKCVFLYNGPPSNWLGCQLNSYLSWFCGLTDFIWSPE